MRLQAIVGARSSLGRALAIALTQSAVPLWMSSRQGNEREQRLELTDPTTWLLPDAPEIAYLCAGVSSIAECRNRPAETRVINVASTVSLAQQLIERGARIVAFSTDLVFDGSEPCPSVATIRSPRTEYGRQKAELEDQLLGLGPNVLVVRLTKVLSREAGIIRHWIECLAHRQPLRAFSDYVCSPLDDGFAAAAVIALAQNGTSGLAQISGLDSLSYADLSRLVAVRLGCEDPLIFEERAVEHDFENVGRFAGLQHSERAAALGFPAPTADAVVSSLLRAA
jgi:dTDP-4-dehydrorhamnose reductase